MKEQAAVVVYIRTRPGRRADAVVGVSGGKDSLLTLELAVRELGLRVEGVLRITSYNVCYTKLLRPTYDVFDEARYFEPAPTGDPEANILRFRGRTIAVTICEDTWNDKDYWERRTYARDPLEEAAAHSPDP